MGLSVVVVEEEGVGEAATKPHNTGLKDEEEDEVEEEESAGAARADPENWRTEIKS